jgi:hypothetical protein
MNAEDLRARQRRLVELVAGLSQEESLWQKCSAPVLAVERQEYMDAIHNAIHSLESARIALVKLPNGGTKNRRARLRRLDNQPFADEPCFFLAISTRQLDNPANPFWYRGIRPGSDATSHRIWRFVFRQESGFQCAQAVRLSHGSEMRTSRRFR